MLFDPGHRVSVIADSDLLERRPVELSHDVFVHEELEGDFGIGGSAGQFGQDPNFYTVQSSAATIGLFVR